MFLVGFIIRNSHCTLCGVETDTPAFGSVPPTDLNYGGCRRPSVSFRLSDSKMPCTAMITHCYDYALLHRTSSSLYTNWFNPLNPELNPICYLLALFGAHHFLHVSRIRVKLLTFRRLMSYIYMEHPFLMFLDHTQRHSTVGRTPLDE